MPVSVSNNTPHSRCKNTPSYIVTRSFLVYILMFRPGFAASPRAAYPAAAAAASLSNTIPLVPPTTAVFRKGTPQRSLVEKHGAGGISGTIFLFSCQVQDQATDKIIPRKCIPSALFFLRVRDATLRGSRAQLSFGHLIPPPALPSPPLSSPPPSPSLTPAASLFCLDCSWTCCVCLPAPSLE